MKKERWRYSREEVALLRELCRAEPPLTWKAIAQRFPGRTIDALRDKAKQMGMARTTGIRGRPRTKPVHIPKCVDSDEHDEDQIRAATIRLGFAVEELFERQGWRIAA